MGAYYIFLLGDWGGGKRTKLRVGYIEHFIKYVGVPVVETELHFLEVEVVVFFVDSVVFVKPLLGETPESFDSVDVCAAFGPGMFLVDATVFSVLFQALVAFEAVGVVHRPLLSLRLDFGHQSRGANIRDYGSVDLSIAFQYASDFYVAARRDFIPRVPKTIILLCAPRPRLPLRFPPKYVSSISSSPRSLRKFSRQYSAIFSRKNMYLLRTVL